ncbi:transposase [Nevskia ramosa]|uniref:transposase n=1 Tax=Nevskia ramosa TaxID=64002 RepID=UPI0023555D7C|nr:transposase [Nevskia ramosa]
MARLPRMVLPGTPHHVTQRGNRRERIFFSDTGYALYRDLLAESCKLNGVEAWSWCLMPNHVHLILVPSTEVSLARALGETRRRYTGFINARNRQTGHLFQGRYGSMAMDEAHLIMAALYVAMKPVKARLVDRPDDWPWSSVRAHLAGTDDELVRVRPRLDRAGDFAGFLDCGESDDNMTDFYQGQAIGRPPMSVDALQQLEKELGRATLPATRGRKPRMIDGDDRQKELKNY